MSTRRSMPGRRGAFTRSRRSGRGDGDRVFLERVFQKLLLNFTWWVNRKDAEGRNVFQGGFLGLDNIGVFDRSAAAADRRPYRAVRRHELDGDVLPNMLAIAHGAGARRSGLRGCRQQILGALPLHRPRHEHLGETACATVGRRGRLLSTTCCTCRTARIIPLKIRSMVGLIPLFAVETLEPELLDRLPGFKRRLEWFIDHRPDLTSNVACMRTPGTRRAAPAVDRLAGPAAPRAAGACSMRASSCRPTASARSRVHHDASPTPCRSNGHEHRVDYEPAESTDRTIRRQLELARTDLVPGQLPAHRGAAEVSPLLRRATSRSSAPRGSGQMLTLGEVAAMLSQRLSQHLPARRARATAGLRRRPERFRRIRTGATWCHSMSTSTATRARRGRQPSDWMDRTRRQAPAAVR